LPGVHEFPLCPTLYVYPDDPRPDVRDLMARYRAKYGIDMNYIGQTGVSVAQIALEALQRAGRDLTVDSLVIAMESLHEFTDIYGNTYSFGPNQHHGSTKAFLSWNRNLRPYRRALLRPLYHTTLLGPAYQRPNQLSSPSQ
jgi:branched-chain amino acid transport system substrate-binding protein